MNLNAPDAATLERDSKEQSKSSVWHKARLHRITASNFHRVAFRREKTEPSKLLASLLYNKCKQTAAMQFGLENEETAAQRFIEDIKSRNFSDIKLEKRGFVVDKDKPYLGASVDRIAVLDGHEYIVELKNPSSTWDLNIQLAAVQLPCLKVDENNVISLNRRYAYYTQVQGQMAVLGVHKCYFVLCTEKDIHVEFIPFNETFWKSVVARLETFYMNIFLPEIVYPSVKYDLPALDLSKF